MSRRIPEENLIKGFRKFYEILLNKAELNFAKGNYEKSLELISLIAEFAWHHHPGVFSESRLDKIILSIGEKLESLVETVPQPLFEISDGRRGKKKILHIATALYDVGGHSRLVSSWLKQDAQNSHTVVVTNQDKNKFPQSLIDLVESSGGKIEFLTKSDSVLSRAAVLREISRHFDFVILHQNPNDVIPLLAFAVKDTSPVALLNHADHVFWLGASVIDLVIDLRTFGTNFTLVRRKGKKSLMIPMPLDLNEENISREEARKKLSINDDQVVLLSIGTEYKYLKTLTYDFSETGRKILDKNPHALLYVIGPKPNEERFQTHERMKFLGVVPNPILYQKAADIYLEGFPFGSFTALLETVLHNVYPVLMYSPRRIGTFDLDMGLSRCAPHTNSEEEYIKEVTKLITEPEKRNEIAEQIKNDVIKHHCGTNWREYVEEIYEYLENINHEPKLIEKTAFLTQEEDLYLIELRNNHLQFLKYPIWIDICANPKFGRFLTFSDVYRMFYESLKIKDTKSLLDIVRWRNVLALIKLRQP